jgi:hypothetical protein
MPMLKVGVIAFGETVSPRGLSCYCWICAAHFRCLGEAGEPVQPKVAFSVNITASFWLANCDHGRTLFNHPDFAHFILPLLG